MGRSMPSAKSVMLFVVTLLASLNVAAQQITGSIRGTVVDPSSAIVQAASVTAKQIETGLTRNAVTDRQGEYVLVELPIGHYQLEVRAKGFQTIPAAGNLVWTSTKARSSPSISSSELKHSRWT